MSMPLSSSIVRRWEESHLWVSHRVPLRYSSQWKRKSEESWSASLLTSRKSKGLIIVLLGVWMNCHLIVVWAMHVLCIVVGDEKRWIKAYFVHSLTLLGRIEWVCDKIPWFHLYFIVSCLFPINHKSRCCVCMSYLCSVVGGDNNIIWSEDIFYFNLLDCVIILLLFSIYQESADRIWATKGAAPSERNKPSCVTSWLHCVTSACLWRCWAHCWS